MALRTNTWAVACLCLLSALAGCAAAGGARERSLWIGMSHADAIETLAALNASDFSSGMSVATADGRPVDPSSMKEVMWSVPGYGVSLETQFREGRLASIKYWDDTQLKPAMYIHMQAHAAVSRIDFAPDREAYRVEVVREVPALQFPGERDAP